MLGAFLDDPAAARLRRGRRAAAGSVDFAGRLEHDEVAERGARRRRAGLPEHLPGGVRDGRRRGRRRRARCRSAPGTRASPRSAASSPRALPSRSRELVSFPLGDGAVEAIAERLNALVRADARPSASRRERRAARDRARACGAGRASREA